MSDQSTVVSHAEQSVIGALLLDNDALYRIADLTAAHFYRNDHRTMFSEIGRQVAAGRRCDALTLHEALRGKFDDFGYLNQVAQSVGSAAGIVRYAEIVIDKAIKRSLAALGGEMQELQGSGEPAALLVDRMASKVEALAQKKTKQEPQRMSDMLGNYVEVIEARMEGRIKPIQTGFSDLDRQLDGGLERGTLTVIAARPSMGKTAMGLCVARNVSFWGTSLFLSMEMSRDQVNDRNIAALGSIPIAWLRSPNERDQDHWAGLTAAAGKAQDMNLFIDDQTGLNMLDIRSKARNVKRQSGLDVLVIDQLSFITGGESDKSWEVVGEYTRGLLALSKELNIAIVLLCQLNRKCEERQNKRPMLSDLAVSGSIEQDAANVIFLYRDEIYNTGSRDTGICEVITAKQRQGQPGTVALQYIGHQTLFADMDRPWSPQRDEPKPCRGFD